MQMHFGGALNAGPDFLSLFQEKDMKQYMDDCGNIMSVHNVKVKPCFLVITASLSAL